jgi:aspartate aminotransferase/aminotransferase
MSKQELADVAAVAEERGLLVISDEIYEQFTYDGAPASMAGMLDNLLVLNGFSKNAAMTGWRVGYAAGPEAIINEMNTLQQYTFVCAPSMAQHAAVVALSTDMTGRIEQYRRKRDIVYEGLKDNFNVARPAGAFYIFPEAPGGDGEAFVRKAIENNILIIPGSVFSDKNTHFRLSFAADDDTLRQGVDALNELAAHG